MALAEVHAEEFYLSAGECGPEQTLPVALLVSRLIEVATNHANELGVGYENLIAHGQTWVLSRVAVEMDRYPRVDERYSVVTWVEKLNRHFSTRNYMIAMADGSVAGYARTVWVGINVADRTLADISRLAPLADVALPQKECPIAEVSRHRPVAVPDRCADYCFRYSDIDSNRHVNTVRYVELLLNQWPLEFHDSHCMRRLEMSFMRESYFGEKAQVRLAETESAASADISVDGSMRCHFEIKYDVAST